MTILTNPVAFTIGISYYRDKYDPIEDIFTFLLLLSLGFNHVPCVR